MYMLPTKKKFMLCYEFTLLLGVLNNNSNKYTAVAILKTDITIDALVMCVLYVKVMLLCFFELRFNVLVNKFSIMLGQGHCFLGINQYSGALIKLHYDHYITL